MTAVSKRPLICQVQRSRRLFEHLMRASLQRCDPFYGNARCVARIRFLRIAESSIGHLFSSADPQVDINENHA
jgi:hypothetical protein